MTYEDLLNRLGCINGLSDTRINQHEIIQVEMDDESYRDIKEVFFLEDKTIIRLEQTK